MNENEKAVNKTQRRNEVVKTYCKTGNNRCKLFETKQTKAEIMIRLRWTERNKGDGGENSEKTDLEIITLVHCPFLIEGKFCRNISKEGFSKLKQINGPKEEIRCILINPDRSKSVESLIETNLKT